MKGVRTIALACAIAGLATATPAMAAITVSGSGNSTTVNITSGTALGDNFTINFNGQVDGTPLAGVSSSLKMTFQGTSGNSYVFDYLLSNTSSVAGRVSVFGFDTDPNLVGASIVSGFFDTISAGSMENANVEFCLDHGQTNNCNNSTQGVGVFAGSSVSGRFKLTFNGIPSSVTLSDFHDKYQSLAPDGKSALGIPVGAVPEPGTWALMLLGFAGVGGALRRSNRRDKVLMQIA